MCVNPAIHGIISSTEEKTVGVRAPRREGEARISCSSDRGAADEK
jgi:hypothetical protein